MKPIKIGLLLLLIIVLSSCKKEEFVFEVPKDQPVVLATLPYSEFLKNSNPVVTIHVKDIGDITLQLFPDIAPNTVNSLILYAENKAYDNNEFHRVVDGFVIQGVISMARVGTLLDSASSQFFITSEDAHFLNGEYTAFGAVIDGFEIVSYIASLDNGFESPVASIIIESITVERNGYEVEDRICVE
jgi:peptidyl-prolyl cis-trans isomerase B (cyclophilin B)